MYRDKTYAKIIGFFTFAFLFLSVFNSVGLCEDKTEELLKIKFDRFKVEIFPLIIPLKNGMAVPTYENMAITSALLSEEIGNVLAFDSKLNVVIFKTTRSTKPLEFRMPTKGSEIFFLVSFTETPQIMLVQGKTEDKIIKINGKYILGSLLTSIDLKPLGIVVKSDEVSEVLLVKAVESEIGKLIKMKPGWIGIQGQTVTEQLSKILLTNYGVVITNVYEGGPAYKAGLKRGDVIIEIDKTTVKTLKDLQDLLSTKFSEEKIQVKFLRDGSVREVSITLEEIPEELLPQKPQKDSIKGVELTEIPENVKKTLKTPIKGAYVSKVREDSNALGIIKEGDIIVEVNRKTVENLQEAQNALLSSSEQDMLILLYRQDSFQYVIIPYKKSR